MLYSVIQVAYNTTTTTTTTTAFTFLFLACRAFVLVRQGVYSVLWQAQKRVFPIPSVIVCFFIINSYIYNV